MRHLWRPRFVPPRVEACNRHRSAILIHRCREAQARSSVSRGHPVFSMKMMQAYSSFPASLPQPRSRTDRLLPESLARRDEAEFPPAAQTALELLEWTFRGSRAMDCASLDALRPQRNWFNTEDYYEISISREKLAAPAPQWTPTAVRYARHSRGVEGSRTKELLAENHGLLRRCRYYPRRAAVPDGHAA